MFTLVDWLIFAFLLIIGVSVTIVIGWIAESKKASVISGIVCAFILALIMFIIGWWNTNTAAGQRRIKDNQSNINNGIDREIVITAEDGREIFRYEGKIDIESNHEDNYIKFDDESGKRYIIYYGIQDTITIIEKQVQIANGFR